MNRHSFSLTLFFLSVFILVLAPIGPLIAKGFDDSEIMHIEYPEWFKESPFYDLNDDLEEARSVGKQGLMVFFTTQGCSYCNVFINRSLGDPEIASIVKRNFDVVGLEIFDDTEMADPRGNQMPIKKFAEKVGANFAPTLVFYNGDGEVTVRAVGYQSPERFKIILDYLTNGHYRTGSLNDYYRSLDARKNSKPSNAGLNQDSLFSKPPYVLDRNQGASDTPLLVIFEKLDCKECDDFHAGVLSLKEVRDTLKKFKVVRFDAEDDTTKIIAPDGKQYTPASWFKKSSLRQVPALVFFNEKGSEVLKTDALVLHNRMKNSLNYVLEAVYDKGWSYQRFARSKGLEKLQTAEEAR